MRLAKRHPASKGSCRRPMLDHRLRRRCCVTNLTSGILALWLTTPHGTGPSTRR
jgi:hypothetical protein